MLILGNYCIISQSEVCMVRFLTLTRKENCLRFISIKLHIEMMSLEIKNSFCLDCFSMMKHNRGSKVDF